MSKRVVDTGTNTTLDGRLADILHGTGELVMALEELALPPGHFELTIGMNHKFVQHVYERHDRAYELVVRRGDEHPAVGLFRITADWSLNDAAAWTETTGSDRT
jgi:hypothetical protein